MGIKDVVINLRASNQALEKRLLDVKRQNARMRDVLVHDCAICRCCTERERLIREALPRELQTLKVGRGDTRGEGRA